MIVVKTKVAESKIHGVGVIADQHIPSGSVIWQWHEEIDRRVPIEYVESLPAVCQEYFKRYGWIEKNEYIICIDDEQYINHSDTPNCIFTEDGNTGIATKDIEIGEEITQDYSTFDDKFGLEEFGYDW